jgi:hypothetical protein
MPILAKFYDDWSDEFDVTGFQLFHTEFDWNKFLNNAEKANYPVEKYFGSNEFLTFNSFKEYESCFEVIEITQDEYDTMKKLFPYGYFGDVPEFEAAWDIEDETSDLYSADDQVMDNLD